MHSINFFSPKFQVLNRIVNLLISIFWHFIVIHLAIVQTQTIILNMDKSLDEFIDYVMIGSIYIYGYWILCFWQFNSAKLSKLMELARQNFRSRSARGELFCESFRELTARAYVLPTLLGLTFVSFDKSVKMASKYCRFWVYSCLAGEKFALSGLVLFWFICFRPSGTLSWIVYPLVQCYSCKMLPLKSWYPIDVDVSPNYEVAFVLQFFGQVFVGVGELMMHKLGQTNC